DRRTARRPRDGRERKGHWLSLRVAVAVDERAFEIDVVALAPGNEKRTRMSKIPQILIVDDERSILLALEAGLSLSGFSVTCVRGGNEAIREASQHHFDAIVCDIFMPDGDGLTVVRELRVLHQTTPIILMTAQGSVELAVQALSEGASDFIAKPFEVTALAALLRRYIDAHREAQSAEPEAEALFSDFSRSGLVGRSAAMVEIYKLIAHAARSDATA